MAASCRRGNLAGPASQSAAEQSAELPRSPDIGHRSEYTAQHSPTTTTADYKRREIISILIYIILILILIHILSPFDTASIITNPSLAISPVQWTPSSPRSAIWPNQPMRPLAWIFKEPSARFKSSYKAPKRFLWILQTRYFSPISRIECRPQN